MPATIRTRCSPVAFPGGSGFHPLALEFSLADTLKSYGLVLKTQASEQNNIWSCPTRSFLPGRTRRPHPDRDRLSVFRRHHQVGQSRRIFLNAPSPVKLSTAKPNWCLAAESNAKFDTGWGQDEPPPVSPRACHMPALVKVIPTAATSCSPMARRAGSNSKTCITSRRGGRTPPAVGSLHIKRTGAA